MVAREIFARIFEDSLRLVLYLVGFAAVFDAAGEARYYSDSHSAVNSETVGVTNEFESAVALQNRAE